MARFTSDILDLSRLPDPALIPIDYEAILADRMAAAKKAFADAGLDYDVEMLEFDPVKVVEEVDAKREIIAREAINDAGRSNMLAHARGAALDQLGANLNVGRQTIGLDNQGLPILETDDRFRRRIQLAPEAFATAGSHGGYVFHALTACPTVADVSVVNPAPGEIVVSVMGDRADPTPTAAEVTAVRDHLSRDDIKPMTDILTVRAATVISVPIAAQLKLYRGPDQSVVLADARANLETFLAQNKRMGRDLRLGAWLGRLYRDTVHSAIPITPTTDILATPYEVVYVPSIALTFTGVDE